MAIAKAVRNYTCIVPVRFTRAVTGRPVLDAPDVDDRGYAMQRSGLTASDAHGAMVGMTVGDTVRVRVVREDVEAAANLFVTSSDPAVVAIANPAGGGAVPADGSISIRAVADLANRPVIVQVRFGAIDGPVIGELEPHVFSQRDVRVLCHLVTIDGVATTQTAAGLVNFFRDVNAIWRPAGVNFVYNQADTVQETIVGNRFRQRDGTMAALPAPLGPAGGYATAGTVTTNIGGGHWEEFSTLLQIYADANSVNVYFVHAATEFNGLTYDRDIARPNGYGVCIQDAGDSIDTAHELGHFLDLDHHADEDASGNVIRSDMWMIRRLMYSTWPPAAPAWRHDVGYGVRAGGTGQYGAMISLKNLGHEDNDNETTRSRQRARNPY